jgi:arginyl-tRNA synthetase
MAISQTVHDIVAKTVAGLMDGGVIPAVPLPAFDVIRPQIASHGDYATNVAMKLAPALREHEIKLNPRTLADLIAERMRETVHLVPAYDLVGRVEVAGPGFINVHLDPAWLLRQADVVLAAGDALGRAEVGTGRTVNLEFVSANPTGPVTVGNGRGAFLGDALGNILRAAGYDVTKEYYFNDAGQQFLKLGFSMERYCRFVRGDPPWAALDAIEEEAEPAVEKPTERFKKDKAQDEAAPKKPRQPKGYYGPYYETVALRLLAEHGPNMLEMPLPERHQLIGQAAAAIIMADIKETMRRLKVEFDVFFNQSVLEPSGQLQAGIETLRQNGFLEERDGAVWMKSSRFGDDQDRVVVRSDGVPTYITSDVAYMRNKFERGFQTLIFVLGPDHHGYVGRLKATAAMLGHRQEDAHVLLYGQVNLKVGGKTMRMGKRLGNAVTLDDLYEDVGADVARFFYLMRANDTPLDFDLELARKQSSDNPGLSVQYAHARVCGVFRKAAERGFAPADYAHADMQALASDPARELDAELNLMRQILRLEEVVERAAETLEPHHLTTYGSELAEAYHIFYDNCPIIKAGADVTRPVQLARLRLMAAARLGLARTLALLGMDAPERMERDEAADAGEVGEVV